MNNSTDWKKLLEEQQQAGMNAEKQETRQTAADPSAITQSYYKSPTTYENFETESRPVYEQSQAVQDAAAKLNEHQANKPGAYEGQYGDQIQGMIDSILNREKFSYDYAADPMYQQYAQQYQRGGQLAMKGAMAESAALTGGYGNSYAQQVGQQTYQQYMENLAGKIPELREAAYNMYQDEGAAMRDNLGMLQGADDRDYGRWRDAVGDWRTDLDMLHNMYSLMSETEYNRYLNDAAAWEADRAYWYQKAYDALQQANWDKEFNIKYADELNRGSGGGGSRGVTDDLLEAVLPYITAGSWTGSLYNETPAAGVSSMTPAGVGFAALMEAERRRRNAQEQ